MTTPAKGYARCSHRGCRRRVAFAWLHYETPQADGWGRLADMGAAPRDDAYVCPLHNMLVREGLQAGDVRDPARSR